MLHTPCLVVKYVKVGYRVAYVLFAFNISRHEYIWHATKYLSNQLHILQQYGIRKREKKKFMGNGYNDPKNKIIAHSNSSIHPVKIIVSLTEVSKYYIAPLCFVQVYMKSKDTVNPQKQQSMYTVFLKTFIK